MNKAKISILFLLLDNIINRLLVFLTTHRKAIVFFDVPTNHQEELPARRKYQTKENSLFEVTLLKYKIILQDQKYHFVLRPI